MNAFLTCGPQGAGKSTYAGELVLLNNATIISGDEIRKELYGSDEIQADWVEIHDKIESYIAECAGRGLTLILDGTYHKKSHRAEAIMLLRSYGYDHIEAVVCCPSLPTCMARNWSRKERNVPDYVLKTTYEVFQRESKDILKEDFSRVTFIH
jgi:predicted kinase